MAEAGFLEPRKMRPGAAAIVVLMHGAALTALLMAKGFVPSPNDIFIETKVIDIDEPDPPPPPPPPRTERTREQATNITTVPRPTPVPSPFQLPPAPPAPPPDPGAVSSHRDVAGIVEQPPAPLPPAPPPPAPPVRRDAVMISGDLQPPYPTSEQRAEREGTVVIRVTVGPDGRVKATEKVRATSDAFYEATERHARARWRFRPATVDGQPTEARKTLTVHFRLDES
jgi:protein TonB